MKKILIVGADSLKAAALAALLAGAGVAVMPTRRPEFEPGYDMNDLIDLEARDKKRAARKEHLKAAGQRAMKKGKA